MTTSTASVAPASHATSTNSAYTFLEQLLLFHNLSIHGTQPASFSLISNILVKNPLLHQAENFDRGRLSPDALRELYHYFLQQAEETAAAHGARDGQNSSNRTGGGTGGAGGAGGGTIDLHAFTTRMKEKFYFQYREFMRRMIRADEEAYAKLAGEMKEIEAGRWDDRLIRAIGGEVPSKGGQSAGVSIPKKLSSAPIAASAGATTGNGNAEPSQQNIPPSLLPIPLSPVPKFPTSQSQIQPPTLAAQEQQQQVPVVNSPMKQQKPKASSPTKTPSRPVQRKQPPPLLPFPPIQATPLQLSPPLQQSQLSPPLQLSPQLQHSPQHYITQPSTPLRQMHSPMQGQTPGYSPPNPAAQSPTPPVPENYSHIQPLPYQQQQQPQQQEQQHQPLQMSPGIEQHRQLPQGFPPAPQLPYRGHNLAHGMQQQGTNGRIVLPQPSQDPQRAPYSRSHPVRSPVQGSHNAPLAQGQQPVMSVYQQPQLPRLIPPQSLSNTSDLRQHASIPPVAPTPTAQTIPNTTPIHSHPQSPNLLPPKPRPSPVITSQHTPGTNVTTVTPTPFIRPHTPPPVAQAVKDIPTTPNRPGSPIQPRPDEISPISTPSASPPPDAAEAQNTADETQSQQGRKRPFEATTAVIETRKEASLDGVMETSGDERAAHQQQQGALAIEDEDSSLRPPQPKRRKSMVSIPPTSTPSTPTPTGLATARTMPVSASDRTAAARAASAAKRARGGRNAGRGRGGRARAAEVDIKTETEEEGSQSIEEEDGAEEKATPRPKRGGRRGGKRGAATAAAAAARRAAAEKAEEEESGEATANEDEPTVKQVEEEDEMEDITTTTDIEATPTPKSVALRNQRHKPVGPSKRKRLTSPPPDVGEGQEEPATPVPTASPTLTSATSIRKPPANIQLPPPAMPKFESQSTTTSTLSSASFLPPTPSPGINGPHTAASTTSSSTATTSRNMVGHQAQVIATKKFQQLSAPLLHNISAHRFANLFMNPVGERVAPGYSKLVHKPMDLKSIKAAIKTGTAAVNAASAAAGGGLPPTEPNTPGSTSTAFPTSASNPPATPSTPSASTPLSAPAYTALPATTQITPPKGIVNSAQLEKELFRMFANAVMYNKSSTEIARETTEMAKEVERWVDEFRSAERVGEKAARAASTAAVYQQLGSTPGPGGGLSGILGASGLATPVAVGSVNRRGGYRVKGMSLGVGGGTKKEVEAQIAEMVRRNAAVGGPSGIGSPKPSGPSLSITRGRREEKESELDEEEGGENVDTGEERAEMALEKDQAVPTEPPDADPEQLPDRPPTPTPASTSTSTNHPQPPPNKPSPSPSADMETEEVPASDATPSPSDAPDQASEAEGEEAEEEEDTNSIANTEDDGASVVSNITTATTRSTTGATRGRKRGGRRGGRRRR